MFRFTRVFILGMFIVVPILMILGAFWQYSMYQDCRADGLKAYQCSAMLSDPHYVAVDNVDHDN